MRVAPSSHSTLYHETRHGPCGGTPMLGAPALLSFAQRCFFPCAACPAQGGSPVGATQASYMQLVQNEVPAVHQQLRVSGLLVCRWRWQPRECAVVPLRHRRRSLASRQASERGRLARHAVQSGVC